MKYRFFISLIIGIFLSLISVGLFTMWQNFKQLEVIFRSSLIRGMALLLGYNFSFDIISFFITGNSDLFSFLAPALLAWIFVGYITGSIAKGWRSGLTSGTLVYVVMILAWILLSVIAGEDLMGFFQGNQLIATVGGLLGALLGVTAGSISGGYISGPEEEYY